MKQTKEQKMKTRLIIVVTIIIVSVMVFSKITPKINSLIETKNSSLISTLESIEE